MFKETKTLNAQTRAALPDSFVEIPDGVVHYQVDGPENGPKVVLVHGFTVPYFIWDTTFAVLTEAGFRVLRFDLFGRGYSDRPRARYDVHLFTRQIHDLLPAVGFDETVHIIGLSMGGIITANFASQYPEKIKKVGLIDPAGFSLGLGLVKLPLVGELILHLLPNKTIKEGIASDFFDKKYVEQFYEQFLPPSQYKGFRRAILSTIRSGILTSGEVVYQSLGKTGLPVILFWGEEDKTVPFKFSKEVTAAIPGVEFHPVAGVGHLPHVERSEIVHPKLIEFLKR